MKSIEAYNKTQSELNKTLNMAFASISRRIEEAIKVGQTHIQEDLPSEEIRNNVHNYFEEKGYICIDIYTSTLCISWDIRAMRAAYFAYKEYKESIKPMQSGKLEVNNDHSD